MDETILALDDINSFIKAFAYWIQIRLEEIQIWHNRSTNQNNKSDLPYENCDHIVQKFKNYFTQKQLEIKLIKKFSERIIQIFQFFKTKSKNQNLLAIIEKKITNKLDILVNQIPLNVEEIFLLAQSLMKKGAMLKSSFQRVQTASRASSRQRTFRSMKRTSTDKLIKVQTVSICQQHPSYSLMPVSTGQDNISKNGTSYIRTFSRSQINRPKSVVNIGKRGQNTSIHKKDPSQNTFQNKSNCIQLDKLYAGMNIDKNYITKSVQRSCFMMKDSLKRNSKLINKLTHANNKRIKTLTDQHINHDNQINRNILAQWNFKTSKLNACTNTGIKSYINRKRKYIGHINMIAQKKLNKKQSDAKQNFPVQQKENS